MWRTPPASGAGRDARGRAAPPGTGIGATHVIHRLGNTNPVHTAATLSQGLAADRGGKEPVKSRLAPVRKERRVVDVGHPLPVPVE